MEQIESSETSARKIQTPVIHPKKEYNVQNTAKFLNQESQILFSFSINPTNLTYLYFNMYWYNIVKKKCHITLAFASLQITDKWAKAIELAQAEALWMIEGERWGTELYTTWAGELCNTNVRSACAKRNNCTNPLYRH